MADSSLRILEAITPSHYSGAERVVTYLAQDLIRLGHEVLVATKPLALLEEELARRGVPCRPLTLSGKFNPLTGRRLRRLVQEFRPQIVHTHLSTASWWGARVAHREGLPCVGHVHGMTTVRWYRDADRLLCPSRGVREYLLAAGVPPERVEVIYNGLDPESFQSLPPPEELRAEIGLPADVPVIGVVAHLSPKKGHHVLLEAMAELSARHPDLHCLCLGRGPLQEQLAQQAERLGLGKRFRLLGYRHDALALTQLFQVAVLPSVQGEGLGLCLIEAAFLGIPGAGSDSPGINEAVENGVTGLLSPPGDVAGLAETLDRLLSDEALRRQMGEAARQRASELFTLRRQAELTVAAFRRLL
ncbi:MAG TPA: glycosyltransferase [Armatimonadota bacterium]|jgi:glycosyltransferase involved in cell wall biosynthesis